MTETHKSWTRWYGQGSDPARTEAAMKRIDDLIAGGMTMGDACREVGMSPKTHITLRRERGLPVARYKAITPENCMERIVVNNDTGCWVWQGALSGPNGYGMVGVGGKPRRASRLFYLWFKGVDPGELFVCHHCDNPPCVNPEHLFLGTRLDNARDMTEKDRMPSGSRHTNSKLTIDDVAKIMEMQRQGVAAERIAEFVPVGTTVIREIKRGEKYRNEIKAIKAGYYPAESMN